MITGGRNLGRVGTVVNRERHPGSFDIVHIKDATGHTFATRYSDKFNTEISNVLIEFRTEAANFFFVCGTHQFGNDFLTVVVD